MSTWNTRRLLNVYISIFVTAYACLKVYEDALESLGILMSCLLQHRLVIYISPDGKLLIQPDMNVRAMGLWTSKT